MFSALSIGSHSQSNASAADTDTQNIRTENASDQRSEPHSRHIEFFNAFFSPRYSKPTIVKIFIYETSHGNPLGSILLGTPRGFPELLIVLGVLIISFSFAAYSQLSMCGRMAC
jgi:hypothetical protein